MEPVGEELRTHLGHILGCSVNKALGLLPGNGGRRAEHQDHPDCSGPIVDGHSHYS